MLWYFLGSPAFSSYNHSSRISYTISSEPLQKSCKLCDIRIMYIPQRKSAGDDLTNVTLFRLQQVSKQCHCKLHWWAMACHWPQLFAGIYVLASTTPNKTQQYSCLTWNMTSTNVRQLSRAMSGGKQTKYKCCQITWIYFSYLQNQCALKTNW